MPDLQMEKQWHDDRLWIPPLLEAIPQEIWQSVGFSPLPSHGQECGSLLTGQQTHPALEEEHAPKYIRRWFFVISLVNRLHKYHRRGVRILDAPQGSLSLDIQKRASFNWRFKKSGCRDPPLTEQQDPPPQTNSLG